MSGLAPSTSEEIAQAAGLNERYVREWLAAMVTGGLVTYEPSKGHYQLKAEYAKFLLSGGERANTLMSLMEMMTVLYDVRDPIVDCFKKGGGVGYDRFHRFHEVMAEVSKDFAQNTLVGSVLKTLPDVWKKLEDGASVLDVGCGRGLAVINMAKAFQKSKFQGYDISQESVDYANQKANGIAQFHVKDVAKLDEVECYDVITAFDVIHDQADPVGVLDGIYKALKPGGYFVMLDIDGSSHLENNCQNPGAPFLYTISTCHCMTVSLANNGLGLGTMWGRELAIKMLQDAGFKDAQANSIGEAMEVMYLSRK